MDKEQISNETTKYTYAQRIFSPSACTFEMKHIKIVLLKAFVKLKALCSIS